MSNPLSGVSDALRALAERTAVPLASGATAAREPALDAPPPVDHVREALRAERREELAREVAAAKAAREEARDRWTRTRPALHGYSHHTGGLA